MVNINTVVTSVRNEQAAVTLNSCEITSLVNIKAGSLPTERTPAPLFLVAVLDKSGSMAGSKLTMLKDTAKRLIAKLRPVDTLALVTYDTNVSVLLPPTLMDETNAAAATILIENLHTGSSTNLSGGLIEGLQIIPSDLSPKTVVSTLLLTDGHANHGVTTAAGIISLMNHTWDKENAPTKSAVYTFGYGSDHNSQMLREIAEAGNGMYYFIENGDKIADCFADVLGGLLSVVAQNLVLTLEAQGDVEIQEIYTEYSKTEVTPKKKIRIQLADIQSEESRDIPLVLSLPSVETASTCNLLKVNVEYFDTLTNSVGYYDVHLDVTRVVELSKEQMKRDINIDAHINRVQTCALLKEAKLLGEQNKCEEGRAMIDAQINKIKESVSAELPLCGRLVQDLEGAKEAMTTYERFTSEGSHRISNWSASHSRQRAAPQSYDTEMFSGFTYCNTARFDMQSMY